MLATGRPDALIVLGVIGFIAVTGLLAGRFACGWFCPFGLLQEILHKIPLSLKPFTLNMVCVEQKVFEGHDDGVMSVCFSPDGQAA